MRRTSDRPNREPRVESNVLTLQFWAGTIVCRNTERRPVGGTAANRANHLSAGSTPWPRGVKPGRREVGTLRCAKEINRPADPETPVVDPDTAIL